MRASKRRIAVMNDSLVPDRRADKRYTIQRPFSGAAWDQYWRRFEGTTVNISSHGILLATAESIPVGACARILIDWPSPESERLELAIVAKVVRTTRNLVAAKLWSHHFQAASVSAEPNEVNACQN